MMGSGSGVDTARKVAEQFKVLHPDVTLEIPKSVGSSGGIKAVAEGQAAIGLSSRGLKSKEEGLGVKAVQIGSAPLVFVVHPSVTGVTNINTDQIVAIFSGQIKNWKELGGPDAAIAPVLQKKGDSDRALLESRVPGFKELKEAPNAIMVDDSDAVGPAFNETKYAITIIKYDAIRDGEVKGAPLMLDNVMFSATSAKSGKYTLGKPVYFVFKGEPAGLAKAFLDFTLSAEGQDLVTQAGLVPVKLN